MKTKSIISLFLVLFSIINAFGQKKYEVVKIDTTTLETINVIYLKRPAFLGSKIYRVMTNKKDSVISGAEKIKAGDKLRLKLVSSKIDIGLKSPPEAKSGKDSFFYKDYYQGKKVNVDYFTEDIIDLYYIQKD